LRSEKSVWTEERQVGDAAHLTFIVISCREG